MIIQPLTTDERAGHPGATHIAILKHSDLTTTTASTAQSLTVAAIAASMAFNLVEAQLRVPFQDTTDAAHNSTAIKVGDAGDDDRYLASTEFNANGAYVSQSVGPAANVVTLFTAADNIVAVATPTTGKNVAALDRGELWLYLAIKDAR